MLTSQFPFGIYLWTRIGVSLGSWYCSQRGAATQMTPASNCRCLQCWLPYLLRPEYWWSHQLCFPQASQPSMAEESSWTLRCSRLVSSWSGEHLGPQGRLAVGHPRATFVHSRLCPAGSPPQTLSSIMAAQRTPNQRARLDSLAISSHSGAFWTWQSIFGSRFAGLQLAQLFIFLILTSLLLIHFLLGVSYPSVEQGSTSQNTSGYPSQYDFGMHIWSLSFLRILHRHRLAFTPALYK